MHLVSPPVTRELSVPVQCKPLKLPQELQVVFKEHP